MVDLSFIFLLRLEIYYQYSFQKLLTNWIFFAYRVIYFWNKLPNQIKNSKRLKKKKIEIELNDFRNNGKKKNLRDFSFLGTIRRITL